ncbi:MAG: macro domain-containing protein, partial [Balneolaceae bacterium]
QAIVNAANAQLQIGGGVAGAIHRKGDPDLTRLTRPLAPIKPGEAVITEAPGLPNQYVIHCLGPVYGRDEPADELLASCYQNALQLVEEHAIESVAFPAISTGAFGYPIAEATDVALDAVLESLKPMAKGITLRFVLFSSDDYNFYRQNLSDRLNAAV